MRAEPPMVKGAVPIFGHMLKMRKDQPGFLRQAYDAHGAPFGINMMGRPCAVLVGPDQAKVFFTQTDKALRMDKAYKFLEAMFGKMGFLQEPEAYQNERPVQLAPFRREKMLSYIEIMQEEVELWLERLGKEGKMDLVDEMRQLTQVIAAHCLMGREFRQKMGRNFWDLFMAMSNALDPFFPPHWPLPKFIRRDIAKKKMVKILEPLIEERRANPDNYDDFLQELLMTKMKDGRQLTTDLAINWVIGFMFAGHETTFSHSSWLLIQLLQNPWYLEKVREEIQKVIPTGTKMGIEHITNLHHIQWAIDESERMRPVAPNLFRYAQEPLEIGDYTIPEGWWVLLDTLNAHHMDHIFHGAQKYDPLRFNEERDEGKGRFKLTGFGGGIHTCTGKNFAHYEMKVIAGLLCRDFELELLTPDPHPVQGKGASGPSQTFIRYRRKTA
ncbi:MAG: cytochrome P450 [Myxococcales bacterium]|nr:cytochrome P450 [Myxococcales bacterium]